MVNQGELGIEQRGLKNRLRTGQLGGLERLLEILEELRRAGFFLDAAQDVREAVGNRIRVGGHDQQQPIVRNVAKQIASGRWAGGEETGTYLLVANLLLHVEGLMRVAVPVGNALG